MRQGFTLIELMIVIAIIAIIAAIAIPNLLESRITANESAAAASLKSGFHAGQTQFQAGAYSDLDGDGRGDYAANHCEMAGATNASRTGTGVPAYSATTAGMNHTVRALTLIAPTYNVGDGNSVGAYKYQVDVATNYDPDGDGANDYAWNESFWSGYATPGSPGNDGRRAFAINVAGVVFATKASLIDSQLVLATIAPSGGAFMFQTDPTSTNPSCNTTNASPYQK